MPAQALRRHRNRQLGEGRGAASAQVEELQATDLHQGQEIGARRRSGQSSVGSGPGALAGIGQEIQQLRILLRESAEACRQGRAGRAGDHGRTGGGARVPIQAEPLQRPSRKLGGHRHQLPGLGCRGPGLGHPANQLQGAVLVSAFRLHQQKRGCPGGPLIRHHHHRQKLAGDDGFPVEVSRGRPGPGPHLRRRRQDRSTTLGLFIRRRAPRRPQGNHQEDGGSSDPPSSAAHCELTVHGVPPLR